VIASGGRHCAEPVQLLVRLAHREPRGGSGCWLGFVPVSLGVGVTTLAVAGIIPFEPWVLMAMPLGSVLEVPFNLYGLHRLEQRRALVLQSQAELAAGQRPCRRKPAGHAAAALGISEGREGQCHWHRLVDAAALSGARAGVASVADARCWSAWSISCTR
jgi:hypothetical protein